MSKRPVTLKGIVIPVEWDEIGNVVAAAISSHDEREYLIESNQNGRELMGCLQKEVEVTGFIRTEKQQKVIVVDSFLSEETTPLYLVGKTKGSIAE